MPNVHIALRALPRACCDSVEHAAVALAESHANREIPTGYGSSFVRHFRRRSDQLEPIGKLSLEHRFALIELTVLASVSGQWDSSLRCVTAADHRYYVQQTVQITGATRLEPWREVIAFQLNSPGLSSFVLRNLACALVWCGYFSPDKSLTTDRYIAEQLFDIEREEFIRFRQDALRVLAWLLAFSLRPSAGDSR